MLIVELSCPNPECQEFEVPKEVHIPTLEMRAEWASEGHPWIGVLCGVCNTHILNTQEAPTS